MDFYALGSAEALHKYAVMFERPRQAAEQEENTEGSPDIGRTALRMAPAAVGMALPWVGTAFQEPLRHSEKGVHVGSHEELIKHFRPGDILLVGGTRPKDLKLKAMISSVTGTPHAEHVAVVVDNHGNVIHSHPEGGIIKKHVSEITKRPDRIQVLRHKDLSPADRDTWLRNLSDAARNTREYGYLAANAAGPGLKPKQYRRLRVDASENIYNFQDAAREGFRDVFIPQSASSEDIEADRLRRQAALRNLGSAEDVKELEKRRDMLRSYAKRKGRGGIGERIQRWVNPSNSPTRFLRTPNACDATGFCSSIPAVTLPAGKVIVPNKLPSRVMPSDYLRSPALKPVAFHDSKRGTRPLEDRVLKHGPTFLRLLAGLGLGSLGALAGSRL